MSAGLKIFEPEKLAPPLGADLPNKTLLRPDEVARFFSVSRKTVYGWVGTGKLTACHPNGGALRIFRASVASLVRETTKD